MVKKQEKEENLYVGDEYAEDEEGPKEPENELEGLYDLMLPPGIPESLIVELVEEFDLEATTRQVKVDVPDTEPREILVLRGDMDTVNEAHDYMIKRLREVTETQFKSPWVKD